MFIPEALVREDFPSLWRSYPLTIGRVIVLTSVRVAAVTLSIRFNYTQSRVEPRKRAGPSPALTNPHTPILARRHSVKPGNHKWTLSLSSCLSGPVVRPSYTRIS